MGTPFIGEVKIAAFNFPPKGWAFCNGQTLPISQNQALYALLGTTYGGDGVSSFGLPNLQGRTPIGVGNGPGLPSVTLGQVGGEAGHTLTINEMAGHTHTLNGTSATGATGSAPGGNLLGAPASGGQTYNATSPNTTLIDGTVGQNAGGQPHDNMQPYQVLNFIIALTGIFPPRN